MGKRYILAVLLSCFLLTSGCSSGQGNNDDRNKEEQKKENGTSLKHYSSNGVSFDYPDDWGPISQVFPKYEMQHDPELNADELAIIVDAGSSTGQGEKYSVSVHIMKRDLPSGVSLKSLFDQTYEDKSYVMISDDTATINGIQAYIKVYKKPHGEPWYQVKDVWLEKDGEVYIISCWALPSGFAELQDKFNIIIDSFTIE